MPPKVLVRPADFEDRTCELQFFGAAALVDAPGARATAVGQRTRALDVHGAEDVGTTHQFLGCALEAHLALLHEDGLVGQRERDVHGLLDDDDRDTAAVNLLDDLDQFADHCGRQAERQLVDHEQTRAGQERERQAEHLLLAA